MSVQQYIPSGMKLVVVRGDNAEWYTTKKEIPLADGAGEDARCPLTEGDVKTVVASGFRVYYHPSQVRFRNVEAEKAVAACRPVMLVYDIPSRSPAANPSGRLRRLGVRVNLSCWVMPEANVPYSLLHGLATQGVRWHVTPYHPNAAGAIVDMVIGSLRRELADTLARAEETQANSEAKLTAEDNDDSTYTRCKKLRDAADGITKRIKTLTDDLLAGAKALGVPASVIDVAGAATAARKLRDAMHERAALYARAGTAARKLGSTGVALANAVAADAIHGGIVGDFLMESDDAETAALGEQVVGAFQTTDD